ncbi:helix-turn-helix domain-containing protein [Bdellovibrio sp. ZAP7]|uniref:helix-turn-helix domain-containing protein n=1 Tax=Bdellovibrio sp. ZAP7 TaxID=2231053 RepID=UPI00143DA004|nr:helix-turn-helix domain-containing protein [Bdellovibrio sp. ZAP7]
MPCGDLAGLDFFGFFEKNGCPTPSLSRNWPPLDIIKFFRKDSPLISDEIAVLYCQGMSITDISARTGIKRHTVWKTIKRLKKESNSEVSVPYDRWRKGKKRTGARPPFGFCILEGELVRDPKEYPTLLLIFDLWSKGMSVTSIVNLLGEKGLRSRTGKEWSYRVVQSITKRIDAKELEMIKGRIWFSEKYLKETKANKSANTQNKKSSRRCS